MSTATASAPTRALPTWGVVCGSVFNVLPRLREGSIHLCVTSPPYWNLRTYKGSPDLLGNEPTVEEYVARLVAALRGVRRVLRDDGSLWLVIGDCYARNGGTDKRSPPTARVRSTQRTLDTTTNRNQRAPSSLKPKDLILVPARVALALQADGWWLRCAAPWIKFNGSPSSVTDRLTVTHETLLHLAKSAAYFYDVDGARKPCTMRPQRRPSGHARRRTDAALPEHTYSGSTRNEPAVDGNPAGRQRRTTDAWREALDARIAYLTEIRDRGGILVDDDGEVGGVLSATASKRPAEGEDHFAVFPEALVDPLIRLSSSEGGACRTCGAQLARVVERSAAEGSGSGNVERKLAGFPGHRPDDHLASGVPWTPTTTTTTGWRPTCDCGAGAEPCIVLDPFCGSGTTGAVATRLGRRFLGVDVSPEYCEMARRRIGGAP